MTQGEDVLAMTLSVEDVLARKRKVKAKAIAHILRMFQPSLKLTYSLYLCVQSCRISC